MSQFPKSHYPVRWIPVNQITVVWPEAQRPMHERAVKKLMEEFDPDCFGVATVCKPNAAGMHHAIDGQTRVEAVRRLWGDKEMVPCQVLDVDDPATAARIFRKMNNGRQKPGALQDYKVAVTAGDPTALAVQQIVLRHGLKVGFDGLDGTVSAVQSLLLVYKKHGPEVLDETIRILLATWGRQRDGMQGQIIQGTADLLATHNGLLDRKRLAEKVSKQYTPARFIGAARQAKDFRGGSVVDAVVSVLATAYNKGIAQEKRLPE